MKGQHMEIPPEESTDLEELEQFAKMFKQKRIKTFLFYSGKLPSVPKTEVALPVLNVETA